MHDVNNDGNNMVNVKCYQKACLSYCIEVKEAKNAGFPVKTQSYSLTNQLHISDTVL
jgi:hypothetical protein